MIWIIPLILIYVIGSIKVLQPNEMAVLVVLGKPIAFRDSGIHFVPLFFCRLEKRPKKMFNLDYPARKVITRKKEYNGVKYGAQALMVDAVAYLNLPRKVAKKKGDLGDLIEIVMSDVPYDEEGLKRWTEDSVVGALRAVFAEMASMESIERIKDVKEETEKKFQAADGALVKAGFDPKNLKLTIKEIELPKELEEYLVKVDQERLKLDAASFIAERQAKEWVGMVLESFAQVRGKSVKEIQEEINNNKEMQREFLDYSKKMNLRLEEAERKALTHIVVDGGEKSNEGSDFLQSLVNAAVKIFAAAKRIPEVEKGERKKEKGKREKEKGKSETPEERSKEAEEMFKRDTKKYAK